MSVGGVETAAVYLSPQAISPLSASKEPIALALAVRPNLSEPSGTIAAKAAEKAITAIDSAGKADKTGARAAQDQQRSSVLTAPATAGVAMAGRVDVYV